MAVLAFGGLAFGQAPTLLLERGSQNMDNSTGWYWSPQPTQPNSMLWLRNLSSNNCLAMPILDIVGGLGSDLVSGPTYNPYVKLSSNTSNLQIGVGLDQIDPCGIKNRTSSTNGILYQETVPVSIMTQPTNQTTNPAVIELQLWDDIILAPDRPLSQVQMKIAADVTPPSVPVLDSNASVSTSSITFAAHSTDGESGIYGYTIKYAVSGTSPSYTYWQPPSTAFSDIFGGPIWAEARASHTITGLAPSTSYTVIITPYDNVGNSGPTKVFAITTSAIPCTYSLSPPSHSHGSGAETGSFSVTTQSGCAWSATSPSWITITSGASGTGNGTVNYSILANPATSVRSGAIAAGGRTFTITQDAAVVTTVSPSALAFSTKQGSDPPAQTVSVTFSNSGLAWTPTVTDGGSWLTAARPNGSTILVSVSAAGLSPGTYTGHIQIFDPPSTAPPIPVTLTVVAQTCSYSLSPSSRPHGAGAESGTFSMATSSGCAWSVVSNQSWLTASGSGPGNGTVNYMVSPNPAAAVRTGTITAAGQIFTVTQQGAACSYSLSTVNGSFSASGGIGAIAVTATSGCNWSASLSDPSWMKIDSGANGSGNGTVIYAVIANSNASTRTGTITVAGNVFTVTQQGVGCSYSLSSASLNVASGGAGGAFAVTATSGCSWTVSVSDSSWVTVTSGANGSGNGSVTFSVKPNSSASARAGTITVAGQVFNVTQQGATCSYSLAPGSGTFEAAGGIGTFAVTATVGCSWGVTLSDSSWITVTAGVSGTGSGNVNYSIAANPGASTRTGMISVGAQVFVITQHGGACSYSISPSSLNFGSGGSSGSFAVTAGSGCSWTATASDPSWITITGGANGNGSGTVTYTVAPNPSSSTRSGTITAGGQVFTVTQVGGSCAYTLSSPSLSIGNFGGIQAFAVNTSAGCSWTATSSDSWLTITGGASGSGTGSVTFRIDANSGTANRSGTIVAGGQTFVVLQQGSACSYTLSPSIQGFNSNAVSGSFNVASPSGCAWSASVSDSSWISLTGGGSGNSNGSVSFSISANPTSNVRTGTILVAGQSFTIVQNGIIPGGPLICTGAVPNPTLAKANGPSEAVGDFVITCTGGSGAVRTVSVNVFLNTQVGAGSQPSIIVDGQSFAGSMVPSRVNEIVFDSISFVEPPLGAELLLRIANVQADTRILGPLPEQVQEYVSIVSSTALAQDNMTQTVATTVSVQAPPPVLTVSPGSLACAGGSTQSVLITLGGGSLSWNAAVATSSSWLQLTNASGSGDGAIQVSCVSGSLAAGTYTATIRVSAPGASNPTIDIPVTFTVSAPVGLPAISVAPNTISLQGSDAAADFPRQSVHVSNSGTGTLNWRVSFPNTPWLIVSASSFPGAAFGINDGTFEIGAAVAGMNAGTYPGTMQITADGAANSPLNVPVTLTVLPGASVTTLGIISGNAQQAPPNSSFAQPLVVEARGASGQLLSGVQVSFSSSGPASISDSLVRTDPSGRAQVAAMSGGAPGPATVTASSGALAVVFDLTAVPNALAPPFISSVGNAASLVGEPIAAGELISVLGTGLGPATGVTFQVVNNSVPTTLAGTRVFINGVPAPVLYASATQVNAVVPWEIGGATAEVQLEYTGTRSPAFSVAVVAASPGVFPFSAAGQAAAINQDGTINGPTNPAPAGSVISIYGTGTGPTSPPSVTGSVPTTAAANVLAATVTINNVSAPVQYAGAAPYLISGATLINAEIPADTPAGILPLALGVTVNGASVFGNPTTIAVQAKAVVGANIALLSGGSQAAPANQLFPQPIMFVVTDAQRRPLPGTSVTFSVTSGTGTVTPGVATTNSLGQAQTAVRAGGTPGPLVVTATTGSFSTTATLSVVPAGPAITSISFMNAASTVVGLVPCGLGTVSGAGLASGVQGTVTGLSASGPFPFTLAGVSITINGIPAPLQSVSSSALGQQVTFQTPCETAPGTATATVMANGASVTVPGVPVSALQPGIFTFQDQNGKTYGKVIREVDGSTVTNTNPLRRGELNYVLVTGLGQVTPPAATNTLGVPNQLVNVSVAVFVGGSGVQGLNVEYLPGAIGQYRVEFQLPLNAPTGVDQSLQVAAVVNNQFALAAQTLIGAVF